MRTYARIVAAPPASSPCVCTTLRMASRQVTRLYDLLYARKATPVVALSRAIARARLLGPRNGIAEVLALEGKERLDAYPFYWAALGDLAEMRGAEPVLSALAAPGGLRIEVS